MGTLHPDLIWKVNQESSNQSSSGGIELFVDNIPIWLRLQINSSFGLFEICLVENEAEPHANILLTCEGKTLLTDKSSLTTILQRGDSMGDDFSRSLAESLGVKEKVLKWPARVAQAEIPRARGEVTIVVPIEWRKQFEWLLAEFGGVGAANAIGCSKHSITKWRKTPPSSEMQRKIRDAYLAYKHITPISSLYAMLPIISDFLVELGISKESLQYYTQVKHFPSVALSPENRLRLTEYIANEINP
jgi:hypothetical protein